MIVLYAHDESIASLQTEISSNCGYSTLEEVKEAVERFYTPEDQEAQKYFKITIEEVES